MTDDRARKKAVRRRMAQTGEKYTEARRALENAPSDPKTERVNVEDPATRGQFGRFTEGARRVVALARDEARTLKHDSVGTEHLLLGLLRHEEDGIAARVLRSLGITLERVHAEVARSSRPGAAVASGQLQFTPAAKQALELALREALSLRDNYIGTEHILLGLARETEGPAARIMLALDADYEKLRIEVIRNLAGPRGHAASTSASEPGHESGIFKRFTERAKKVIVMARLESVALDHHHTGDEHVLLGLLREREGLAGRALEALGVTLEEARAKVADRVPADESARTGQRPFTPRAKRIFERSLREALVHGHSLVGTEHLLLALVRESGCTADAVLLDLGADPQTVRNEVLNRLNAE